MTTFNDDLTRAAYAADGETDNGKTVYPDFPGEKPGKLELTRWVDKWGDGLRSSGYASLLRGEEPYDLKKLASRPSRSTLATGRRRPAADRSSDNAIPFIRATPTSCRLASATCGAVQR